MTKPVKVFITFFYQADYEDWSTLKYAGRPQANAALENIRNRIALEGLDLTRQDITVNIVPQVDHPPEP